MSGKATLDLIRVLGIGVRAGDVHADDVGRVLARLVDILGDLHAAGLAAAPDQHLAHEETDALGSGDGVIDVGGDLATRHGDPVLGEERPLALIFEEVHEG